MSVCCECVKRKSNSLFVHTVLAIELVQSTDKGPKMYLLMPVTSKSKLSIRAIDHSIDYICLRFCFPSGDSEILSCTVKALKDGHIVAVPTDTIYGLACLAQNSEAVKKIYEVKERNGQKPLAICVGEILDIYK